jgi:hypothetical protein
MSDRERVIQLSTEVATLRLRVQQADTELTALRDQLGRAEIELDRLLSGSSSGSASRPVADRVRELLALHHERAFGPAEISQTLGLGPTEQDALRQALHHLAQKGELLHLAHGAYQSSPKPQPTLVEKGQQAMSTTIATSLSPSGSRMKHDLTVGERTFKALPLKRAMLEVVRAAIAAGIHPEALRLHEGTTNAGTRWLRGATVALATRGITDESRWYIDDAFTVGNEVWILSSQWSWDEAYGSSRADLERIQRLFPQLGLIWRRY